MIKAAKRTVKKILHRLKTSNKFSYIPVHPNGFWLHRGSPNKSLNTTASAFNVLNGKNIIEIGTGTHGDMSGNSMVIWTRKTNAKRIIAIDLEQTRLDEVKLVTQGYDNVELVLTDGIEFARTFDEKIDLLYLDFWTPDPEGSFLGTGRAQAYKAAYQAARDQMNEHSLILIDDTDHVHPWKHTYIIPEARKDGFVVMYTGRQTLLQR